MAEETNKKIRRHGKVHELPAELRKEVDLLLLESTTTYEDAAAFVKSKGHDISKSALGRYGKDYLARYQRVRMIEDQSRALLSDVGDGLVLDQAAGKLMVQAMIELQMKEDGIKPADIPYFADGLSRIIKANVSVEKLRSDLQKKVDKATDDVAKLAKSKGLGKDSIEIIKKKIQGIRV